MIIDPHRHLWAGAQRYAAGYAGMSAPRFQYPTPDFRWETASAEVIADMDAAGIDRTVLVVHDFEARLGPAHFTIEEDNETLVSAARRYPDRLIAFFGIDPRRPGSADLFERAIREHGVRGLKFHPTVGFFPHDPACTPFYELCVAHDIPLLSHTAPAFHPRLYNRTAHPFEFDAVAADFPRLTMLMAHAGGEEWWEDLLAIAKSHPNMILELSEWQVPLRDRPDEIIPILERMRSTVGAERMVWATDYPSKRKVISLTECIEVFRTLPSISRAHGARFTDADVAAMLGGNADRILRLSASGS